MSDTSTESAERARRKLILHGYSESADLLRALAAERDALRAALQMQVSASEGILAVVKSRGADGDGAMIAEQEKFLRLSRAALDAYEATKEQSE